MNLQTSLRKLWRVKNHLAYQLKRYVFLHSSRKSQFTSIFNSGGFGASPSLSGAGSDMAQTQVVRSDLPKLIKKYAITSMLDVPCGDWYWMQHIDLTGVDYTGADIVDGLISADNNRFGGKQIKFVVLDMVQDDLPMVDLIFCRDCLIHLTLEDGRKAIQHFKDSGSKWLLTTTYTSRTENTELGKNFFRPINLQCAPFNLPQPLEIINESCTHADADGEYSDKSLGLWRISDLYDARLP